MLLWLISELMCGVVEAQRMVTNINRSCAVRKVKRTSTSKQMMGDLPSYRYDAMSPPW